MRSMLHVGCGPKRVEQTTKGFRNSDWNEVRYDIDPSVVPDVVGTMVDMSIIPTGSMDALFSSHNVEHLYPHEVPIAFSEFRRVLKDDGFAVITCPDLQSVAKLIAEDKLTDPAYVSPAGPIAPIDVLFGHRASMQSGNLFMAHHCGFTKRVLMAYLQEAGFASVAGMARPAHFDLWAIASGCARSEADMRELASQHFPFS
jgi:predicted SAM-dependent methyltransferase